MRDSFPRRLACTRRFTLGAPRNIRIAEDGSRIVFLRSNGPTDPVNRLWAIDLVDGICGEARIVVDPQALGADHTDLPDRERTRRERARETADGIVSYDATADLGVVVFALGGRIGRVDLCDYDDVGADRGRGVRWLKAAPGAFDPRLSPCGSHVGYVCAGECRVTGPDGDRLVVGPDSDTVTWGSAEFVAAEEMGRTRGFWWAPQGDRLLVQRTDVAAMKRWWIAAPVDPEVEPRHVRYPAAGTPNAEVSLAIIGLDGRRRDVDWNASGEWEYLARVDWTADGLVLLAQARDQQTAAVLEVDVDSGAVDERQRIRDSSWVELVRGAPRLHRGQLVNVEDRSPARRLCINGEAVTGEDMQVLRLVAVDDDKIVVIACSDPTTADVVSVDWNGTVTRLTNGEGVYDAVVGGPVEVRTCSSLEDQATDPLILLNGEGVGRIANWSEPAPVELNIAMHRLGRRRLATAVLLPAGHDGSALPVLLDPYGGPHAQRVQASAALFHTSQWFADQGLAVIVADGRGTPGRGPDFERAVRGDLCGYALNDQIEALHAAVAEYPFCDLGRVAIRGWSFGGYLAAAAVLRRPDVFHAAIAGAPVTDWRLYDTHYTERYLGDPHVEPDNYTRTDLCGEPAAMGDRPMRPLMLIHGLADDNVVAAHTFRLSRALLEAGKSHTVLPLSGVTHMTPQQKVAESLLLAQLDFLRKTLRL